MADGGNRAKDASICNENIEFTPALMNRAAETINRFHIGNVERNERGGATDLTNFVVKFFQTANSTCDGDHMSAALCKLKRKKISNAA